MLILRDVLEWSARETSWLLESSVASVNSALQRAHATLAKELPASDARAPAGAEDALLRRLMDAWERADAGALAALLREDARLTMPPTTSWYDGRDAIATFFAEHAFGPTSPGEMRVVATAANRQPAVAVYLRRPGDSEHRAFALTLLRVERGAIAELTLFHLPELFAAFGLPPAI